MTSVITGDIIGSQSTNKMPQILESLKQSFKKTGLKNSEWNIYRGDSFQLEVKDIEKVIETAIYIKACIKSLGALDVRMAIGLGDKTYKGENVTLSSGSAFVNSGETLETLKSEGVNLKISSGNKFFDEEINLYLRLGLIAMDNWTQNSAEIVKIYFENPTMIQKDIAKQLGISQNAVSKRQSRAHLDEIIQLIKMYKSKIKTMS